MNDEIISTEKFQGIDSKFPYREGIIGFVNHLGPMFSIYTMDTVERNLNIKRECTERLPEIREIGSGLGRLYNQIVRIVDTESSPVWEDEIYILPDKSGLKKAPTRDLLLRAYDFLSDNSKEKPILKEAFEALQLGDIEQELAKLQRMRKL